MALHHAVIPDRSHRSRIFPSAPFCDRVFLLTFAISWSAAFLVAAPHVLRGQSLPKMTGILMFPAMLLGPSLASILLTRFLDGRAGLRDSFLACVAFASPGDGTRPF